MSEDKPNNSESTETLEKPYKRVVSSKNKNTSIIEHRDCIIVEKTIDNKNKFEHLYTLLKDIPTNPYVQTLNEQRTDKSKGILAFNHVEGEELSQMGWLSQEELIRLGYELGKSVRYLNENGIAHLDIKPENIIVDQMIGSDEVFVKLIDLEIAKRIKERYVKHSEYVSGSPQYMAPETIRGYEPVLQTDVFSYGRVLYELVTGRKLVPQGSLAGKLAASFRGPKLVEEGCISKLKLLCDGAKLEKIIRATQEYSEESLADNRPKIQEVLYELEQIM